MSEENAVVVRPEAQTAIMSLKQIGDRVNLVHKVLETVMKKDTHYGTVPGCGSKMVLLKPGADVLAMTFRLVPQFAVSRTDLPDGHREYDITCSMYGPDGALLGQGVGSASTMEKKYRYRKDAKGNKVENEDIADCYNTVLKIAKKRAHIDATLTVTGAADLFTQDLIDEDDEPSRPDVKMPKPKEKPAAKKEEDQPGKPEPEQTSDGELIETGLVDAVTEKKGEKNGTAWTRYGVKIAGVYYNTFSDTIANKCRDLQEEGQEVTISYKTNDKGYHDIIDVM
jgi:hypothetical protein